MTFIFSIYVLWVVVLCLGLVLFYETLSLIPYLRTRNRIVRIGLKAMRKELRIHLDHISRVEELYPSDRFDIANHCEWTRIETKKRVQELNSLSLRLTLHPFQSISDELHKDLWAKHDEYMKSFNQIINQII